MKSLFFSRKFLLSMGAISSIALFSYKNNAEADIRSNATKLVVQTTMPEMIHDTAPSFMAKHAEAKLTGTYTDTTVNGSVTFNTDPTGKIIMTVDITVPAKAGKTVALHIHEHGDCGDMGKMAHGHWNPTNEQHGEWGSANFHAGDIGNIKLNEQGQGSLSITTDLWTLGGQPDKNILSKSIIVHGGMDDYKSQPTGNSGTRIGCGVIQ